MTVLMYFAALGWKEAVEELCRTSVDLSKKTKTGKSAMDFARMPSAFASIDFSSSRRLFRYDNHPTQERVGNFTRSHSYSMYA